MANNHKRPIWQNLRIPIPLNNRLIELSEQKIIKGNATLYNCLYIISSITSNQKKKYRDYKTFRSVPSSRFKSMIGEAYNKPLNLLLDNGILERSGKAFPAFTNDNGKRLESECYKYRIHPDLTDSEESVKVKFKYTERTPTYKEFNRQREYREQFIKDFNLLDIPFMELYKAVEDHVNSLKIDNYEVNERMYWKSGYKDVHEIDSTYVELPPVRMSLNEALLYADQKNMVLFSSGGKIKMMYESMYMEDQRAFVRNSWLEAIDNLKEGNLYAKRKNRLYSNFTNFPKKLLEIIKKRNNLGESDVKSSQPAFLAYLLDKEGIRSHDINEFQRLVNESDIYLHFAKDGMSRGEAKTMMFKILFSKPTSTFQDVEIFRNEFPNVMGYIDDFKTKEGNQYNDFAIMLQTIESEVFIDGIYPKLRALNIPFFTKHDSIIYNRKDADIVQKVMHDHFIEIGFRGQLDHEYKLNEQPKIKIA
ncbi:hypothetical protein [Zobellia sp. 1_MG-2023]|uniref:hypothetical protein n=1 Tax=Zobellia sp. 1_MG-2023 TaxID=3062626 RepID=UPI0026E36708|nr:hypothetical protein [Zobellia sp. 1_MG-2023]MDO6819077.1 hypothetical protein [Zobellia sp. 1_MG-2023]